MMMLYDESNKIYSMRRKGISRFVYKLSAIHISLSAQNTNHHQHVILRACYDKSVE